jgi:hypothetical protein
VILYVQPAGKVTDVGDVVRKSFPGTQAYQKVPIGLGVGLPPASVKVSMYCQEFGLSCVSVMVADAGGGVTAGAALAQAMINAKAAAPEKAWGIRRIFSMCCSCWELGWHAMAGRSWRSEQTSGGRFAEVKSAKIAERRVRSTQVLSKRNKAFSLVLLQPVVELTDADAQFGGGGFAAAAVARQGGENGLSFHCFHRNALAGGGCLDVRFGHAMFDLSG